MSMATPEIFFADSPKRGFCRGLWRKLASLTEQNRMRPMATVAPTYVGVCADDELKELEEGILNPQQEHVLFLHEKRGLGATEIARRMNYRNPEGSGRVSVS